MLCGIFSRFPQRSKLDWRRKDKLILTGDRHFLLLRAEGRWMGMTDRNCSECGGEMDQIEKTTFTGREMREYECRKCGRKEIVDSGPALWQILSDANKPEDE